jgi:hypothetical protein
LVFPPASHPGDRKIFYIYKKGMAKKDKRSPAKYSDKSAGQPELVSVYDQIKKLITKYSKGNYKVIADKPGHYELYYGKEVEISGRKYPEVSFASLLVQKGYVGFYFFPVYIDVSLKNRIKPELLKTLKGKTCFHIKKEDPVLLKQINETLEAGHKFYTDRGWN